VQTARRAICRLVNPAVERACLPKFFTREIDKTAPSKALRKPKLARAKRARRSESKKTGKTLARESLDLFFRFTIKA
jgi:hypothetical protein